MEYKKKELFRFLFAYQKKYLHIAIFTAFVLLVNVLLQLPMPLVTRYLIDNIIPARDFSALNMLCLILLGVIILRLVTSYLMQYLTAKYKAGVHYDMERDLYFHVQELPLSYFTRQHSGYILSRISEISSVESVMADTVLFILRDTLTILVGTVLILRLHFRLGAIALILLPFFVFSLKYFHRKIKAINKKLREEHAQYYGKLEKNINGIEKIKSAVKEDDQGERTARKLSSVIGIGLKANLLSAFASTVSSAIGMVAPFVVLWYGVSEIIRGNLTLGTFFAINSFLGYLYTPARRLTDTGYSISRAMAGLERIYELFKQTPENKEGEPIDTIDRLEFRNVGFSYPGKNEPVFSDLNLVIDRGRPTAIVGHSGEGKSTLVKMLMKFYPPDSGTLLVSGRDAASLSTRALRQKIAYISQKQFILEDELPETLQNQEVKDLLHRFRFEKAPGGSGMEENRDIHQKELSGGQIQKLEIMEALLRDADVVIIDEGTSNIDFSAERTVLKELFHRYSDRIIIFIAHRLTSVVQFDRILVLSGGQIAEDGNHENLLSQKGPYSTLWGSPGQQETQEKQETQDKQDKQDKN